MSDGADPNYGPYVLVKEHLAHFFGICYSLSKPRHAVAVRHWSLKKSAIATDRKVYPVLSRAMEFCNKVSACRISSTLRGLMNLVFYTF